MCRLKVKAEMASHIRVRGGASDCCNPAVSTIFFDVLTKLCKALNVGGKQVRVDRLVRAC
jgi:hypothetical protein